MHRQRLYRLCCFEVNVGEVFVHCKQKEGRTRRQYCSPVDIKMKRVKITAYKVVFFMRQFRFRQSTTNRYQFIIDNRYQSITTRIFAIDWSSIININRLIDIDCHRLSILLIGYTGDISISAGDFKHILVDAVILRQLGLIGSAVYLVSLRDKHWRPILDTTPLKFVCLQL